MRKHFRLYLLVVFLILLGQDRSWAQAVPDSKPVSLDRGLEPTQQDEISSLFENVVAVQRKAKIKNGHFLFHTNFSFDFSDSPYTMYALNLNAGYAIGEFWEIYLNYVPTYAANERSIARKVRELPAYPSGLQPELNSEKAKSSYGIELNWVPLYGKDSWGAYGIIRSDTFVNIGVGQIKYQTQTGNKTKLMLGKTFFISDLWNLRMQAGGSVLETFSMNTASVIQKETIVIGLLEFGTVFYF